VLLSLLGYYNDRVDAIDCSLVLKQDRGAIVNLLELIEKTFRSCLPVSD
jgi:hypothetical protein